MKKLIKNSFHHHVTIVSNQKHFNIDMIMQSATKIICLGNGCGKVLLRVSFYRISLLTTQMKLFIISSQNIVTNNKTLTYNINKGAEVCCSTKYLLLPNGTQLAMYSGIVGYAIVIFAIWLQLPCISNTRTLLFTCTTHGNKNKPFCYRCTRFFVILKTSFMKCILYCCLD